MVEQCIVRGCRSFVGSCNFTNEANSYTPKVEVHTRQKLYMSFWPLCCESEAIVSKMFTSRTKHYSFMTTQIAEINRGIGVLPYMGYQIHMWYVWLFSRFGRKGERVSILEILVIRLEFGLFFFFRVSYFFRS